MVSEGEAWSLVGGHGQHRPQTQVVSVRGRQFARTRHPLHAKEGRLPAILLLDFMCGHAKQSVETTCTCTCLKYGNESMYLGVKSSLDVFQFA